MASTIDQIIHQAIKQLAATSSTPRLDAEVLLKHVAGLTRTALITRANERLSPEHEEQLNGLIIRRARGEPVAYLTGWREFWSIDLSVTPDVLIPRPETELLVEQALLRIPDNTEWTIADLGTGSGAVALAIAKERPRCRMIATDASEAALAIARKNANRLAIENAEFRHGEWLDPLNDQILDMIVSNPPYVAEQDPHLSQGDVRFEPRGALVAGTDGLAAIRAIAAGARQHLRRCGLLLLEHGYDQAPAVRAILAGQGYTVVDTFTDLNGLLRVSFGTA
jgi:release factor glutamine methyltransferase